MTERPSKLTEADIARLAGTVQAPESLHRRVREMAADAQTDAQKGTPARGRTGWALPAGRRSVAVAGAALAAAVAVLLAVALSGGGRSGGGGSGGGSASPTVRATAALTLSPARLPAPGESTSNRSELTASVGGVAFPYWKERFGWRDSGARSDTLGGRAVTTVFYSNSSGQRIGYSIVAGPAPASAGGGAGGTLVRRGEVSYRLSTQQGANVIVWQRRGHLCVMAGRGVGPRTLLALASWGSEPARAA